MDGVIILNDSTVADFKMTILNADGGEAEMCGNGLRCLGKFIKDIGTSGSSFSIETACSILKLSIEGVLVCAEMPTPHSFQWNLLVPEKVHFLNTGVPHVVYFVDDINEIDLATLGKRLRYHPTFSPDGANINIATIEKNKVFIRTYERGVEGETQACGTGATAAALAASYLHGLPPPVTVQVASKEEIIIDFDHKRDSFQNVTMMGTAKKLGSY